MSEPLQTSLFEDDYLLRELGDVAHVPRVQHRHPRRSPLTRSAPLAVHERRTRHDAGAVQEALDDLALLSSKAPGCEC